MTEFDPYLNYEQPREPTGPEDVQVDQDYIDILVDKFRASNIRWLGLVDAGSDQISIEYAVNASADADRRVLAARKIYALQNRANKEPTSPWYKRILGA